jgi:quinohemoprotein ethanol dehydrogenase
MSYSPKTGLAYLPYMQLGQRFIKGRDVPGELGALGVTMVHVVQDAHDGKGALIAWDPVKQEPRWKVWHSTLWNGGTLSTAAGLVFQGTADGYLTAYGAKNGKVLWRFNLGLGMVSAPISFSVGGKQFISALVGYGGTTASLGQLANVGWKYGAQPRRILTFALDGNATLPPTAPPDMAVHALDDPDLKIDQKDVEAGQALFPACALCHGLHLEATGTPGPDLRESAATLDPEVMWGILHNGDRMQHGMPRFDFLTRDQVRQLYLFIRAGARKALAADKNGAVPKQ